ncbi:ribonuclease P protein component [Candidatus Saccharibacteria bacterium]|nr:ribonuclease P protein component [Candidatus Saccharibacteria bacterium]
MIASGFRLRKATDFSRTYKYGTSYNHQSFYIKALQSKVSKTRLAVVVPKKVSKKAVVRNRARRRVYEICRLNWKQFQPGYTIIITAKTDLSEVPTQELETNIVRGLKNLKVIV